MHIIRRQYLPLVIFAASLLLLIGTSATFTFIVQTHNLQSTPAVAANGDVSWRVFDGGVDDPGANTSESTINTGNASGLTKLWQATLPAAADNAPVEEANVSTPSGTMDLVFVNTVKGNLVAFNAATGVKIWQANPSSANYNGQGTKSTPTIDPSGSYIYAYALDGYIHKYNIANGAEISGGGFPAQVTLLPNNIEKGSASLNIANGYLYMTLSGNDGDYGHYVGHVVAVNLSSGAKAVWNAECADITQLETNVSGQANYCSNTQSGIWARPGVKVDPVTGNVFVVTGNGNYNANSGGNNWGDSIVELTPNLGSIVDSYTPVSYDTLDSSDADLGSTAPVILPRQSGSNTPYVLVEGGKDSKLRLLNRTNLSGAGGPRHTGGELQTVGISGEVHEQPAVWTDSSGVTRIFVTDEAGDLYSFKVVTSGGVSSLSQVYRINVGVSSSPFVANGVLYLSGGSLLAYNAVTGARLFDSSSLGVGLSQHWESPTVVNGTVFTSDNMSSLYAFYVPGATPTQPGGGGSSGSGSGSGSGSSSGTPSSGSSSKTSPTTKPTTAPTAPQPQTTTSNAAPTGSASKSQAVKPKPTPAKPTGLAAIITNITSPIVQLLHLQRVSSFISDSYSHNRLLTVIILALPVVAVIAVLYLVVVPRVARRMAARTSDNLDATASAIRVGTGGNTAYRWLATQVATIRQHFRR